MNVVIGDVAVLQKFLLVVVVALLSTLGGCAKPKSTLVVMVGGLGISQLGDVRRAVTAQCEDVEVVNAGGLDGYKANLPGIVNGNKYQRVVMVGHSFGCGAFAEAAPNMKPIDLAVFIDPAWNDFKLPGSVRGYIWFKRSSIGLERQATIIGASNPKVIKGGHNDIPHSAELISEVVIAINRARQLQPKVPDPKPPEFKQPVQRVATR
jgi:hypothetical protein